MICDYIFMQIVNYTKKCVCVCVCVRACVRKLANKIESEGFPRYRPYWIRKSVIILVINSQIVLNG